MTGINLASLPPAHSCGAVTSYRLCVKDIFGSGAYFRMVLASFCGLGNLKVWSTFSLSHARCFAEVLLCLGLYMFYIKFENKKHVFQHDIK